MKLFFLAIFLTQSVFGSPSLKSDCITVGSIQWDEKDSIYHNGRCYVMTYQDPPVDWPTAATMCTDLADAQSGLAMWIPYKIFDWLENGPDLYFNNMGWAWVGVYSTEMNLTNTTGVPDKTDFRFGQSAARTVADSWSTLPSSEGVIQYSANDVAYKYQNYGLIGITSPDFGWADDGPNTYINFLCQYESLSTAYIARPGQKIIPKMMIEIITSVTHAKCNSVCHTHALCNSYAYREISQDCEIYMIGPDDLGGHFEVSWIDTPAAGWKFQEQSVIKADCINLGISDLDRDTNYHNGRCYVLTYTDPKVDWTTAAGGLAMWIPKAIFDWLNLPELDWNNLGWLWVGVYSAEVDSWNTSLAGDKTDFRFGQSPARTVANSWSTLPSSQGVIHYSAGDVAYNYQNYGLIGSKLADFGWADDMAASSYHNYLCQYESLSTAYTTRPGQKIVSKMIIESLTSVTHAKCNSVCHTHTLCNSYAYDNLNQICEIYMIGPDDLGGHFEVSWIDAPAIGWTLFVRS